MTVLVRVYYKCIRVFLYNVFMNVGFMFKTFELSIYHLALWNLISSEKHNFSFEYSELYLSC